jgi:uncharacterized protein (TIGR00369 family)
MESNTESFNQLGTGYLPGHLGIVITHIAHGAVKAEFEVAPHHLAPNGYLHAGSVISLADTAAGYGCFASLPKGAINFTTVELKSNHIGTAREGTVACEARLVHGGRTTQLWDVTVSALQTGKPIALFRCTQMILYPR